MEQDPLAWLRGMGIGSGLRTFELMYGAGELVYGLSAGAVRGIRRLCRRRPAPPRADRGPLTGPALEASLVQRRYAASTARRYRQIADRFLAWAECVPEALPLDAAVARCLAETTGTATAGRADPRHLGLHRTTLCALRAVLEGPSGTEPGTRPRLPPRPPPLPAALPEEVAVLRAAATDPRERLLLVLACGLGLRPGEMAGLRRGDVRLRGGRVHLVLPKRTLEAVLPAAERAVLRAVVRGGGAADCLFPAPHGDGTVPVTVRALQLALRRLCRRAGLGGVTFTRLRKTCQGAVVTSRLRRSGNPESGRSLAGSAAGALPPGGPPAAPLPAAAPGAAPPRPPCVVYQNGRSEWPHPKSGAARRCSSVASSPVGVLMRLA